MPLTYSYFSQIVEVKDKAECLAMNHTTWAPVTFNFDHIGVSYLTLFGAATFDNWEEMYENIADIVDVSDSGMGLWLCIGILNLKCIILF